MNKIFFYFLMLFSFQNAMAQKWWQFPEKLNIPVQAVLVMDNGDSIYTKIMYTAPFYMQDQIEVIIDKRNKKVLTPFDVKEIYFTLNLEHYHFKSFKRHPKLQRPIFLRHFISGEISLFGYYYYDVLDEYLLEPYDYPKFMILKHNEWSLPIHKNRNYKKEFLKYSGGNCQDVNVLIKKLFFKYKELINLVSIYNDKCSLDYSDFKFME